MKKICCFFSLSVLFFELFAQDNLRLDSILRFVDFHIHPTYKHYFRWRTATEMQEILKYTQYDSATDEYIFPPVLDKYRAENWTNYFETSKKGRRKVKTQQKAIASDLRNYDQAGYPQIMYTPGSIYCNSYSPFEKQFAMTRLKRLGSRIVAGMGKERLNTYSTDDHTPFNDFLAEYYYNLLQEKKRFVQLSFTDSLYKIKTGNRIGKVIGFYNTILMVKDGKELKELVYHNEMEFRKLFNANDTPHLYTPMIMSIEGGQVLYGKISGSEENIDWQKDQKDSILINDDLLNNVCALKNLPHRLFFINLSHFTQNHAAGFAKTLDRDPESFQHRIISTLTNFSKLRNNLIRKRYAGLNPTDRVGYRIVEAFLDTTNTKYDKPTYIDIKHLDIKARIQYYYFRRKWEWDKKVNIPIIASHFAVSGEDQIMAAATGLWPNFDKYREVENPLKFYEEDIIKENPKAHKYLWVRGVMQGKGFGGRHLDSFEKGMYKPLNFLDLPFKVDTAFDPFKDYQLNKDGDAGWFNPWSINLFDEEIIEINKSDGIIGLLMDPRQHGAYQPNYSKKYLDSVAPVFESEKQKLNIDSLMAVDVNTSELLAMEYLKSEPMLRNLFYIVRLTDREKAAEEEYFASRDLEKAKKIYSRFIPDSTRLKKDAWDLLAIGSDYDGLIDPLDYAPTASYIPVVHNRWIAYALIFARIHSNKFHNVSTPGVPLIQNLRESKEKMDKLFYTNGRNFILKYF